MSCSCRVLYFRLFLLLRSMASGPPLLFAFHFRFFFVFSAWVKDRGGCRWRRRPKPDTLHAQHPEQTPLYVLCCRCYFDWFLIVKKVDYVGKLEFGALWDTRILLLLLVQFQSSFRAVSVQFQTCVIDFDLLRRLIMSENLNLAVYGNLRYCYCS